MPHPTPPTPIPTDQLRFAMPPQHATVEEERRHRKERLAVALRLFGRFGFEEGWRGTSPREIRSSPTASG